MLKPVLSRLVDKVELRFGEGTWGKRKIRVVTACDAYVRTPFSFTTENRGDSILTIPNKPFWWLRATLPLKRVRTA